MQGVSQVANYRIAPISLLLSSVYMHAGLWPVEGEARKGLNGVWAVGKTFDKAPVCDVSQLLNFLTSMSFYGKVSSFYVAGGPMVMGTCTHDMFGAPSCFPSHCLHMLPWSTTERDCTHGLSIRQRSFASMLG